MTSRRTFLKHGSLVSLSPMLPVVIGNTARAATKRADDKVLVVVQLSGGNDGLNTVVPYADDGYGRARSTLRLRDDDLHKLDDFTALHPSMRAMRELFDDGRLTIVQGVGYPNPNRSHFTSMRIWQTARFDADAHDQYGWLGRSLDAAPTRSDRAGCYIGQGETPVALWGRKATATALNRPADLRLMQPTPAAPALADEIGPLRQFLARETATAYSAAAAYDKRQRSTPDSKADSYPESELGSRLKTAAELIKSGSPARVYYTEQRGYDTHAAQQYTHSRLLREFSDATAAFLNDLRAAKLDDRIVLLAFSEFGRRVQENDSKGTDHGTAGPVFVGGGAVQAGLVGSAPDLANLTGGDIRTQHDFRSVYATLLDNWLGVDSEAVLGKTFPPLTLLRG